MHLELRQPGAGVDAFGGEVRETSPVGVVSGRFDYKSGGEAVQAARLAGRSVLMVKLYSSALARQVTTDWEVRDVARDDLFNVVDVDAVTSRGYVWLTVEGPVV